MSDFTTPEVDSIAKANGVSSDAMAQALKEAGHTISNVGAASDSLRKAGVGGASPAPSDPQVARSVIARSLPSALGMAGGLAGTPLGPAGRAALATAGGTLGTLGEQALLGPWGPQQDPQSGMFSGHSQNPLDLNAAIGGGLQQGALQSGGELPGALAQPVGKFMVKSGLGALGRIATRFPEVDVPGTIIGENLPSSAAARIARKGSSAALSALQDQAEQAGWSASDAQIAQPAIDGMEQFLKRPLSPEERASVVGQVRDQANEILSNKTYGAVPFDNTSFNPSELQAVKQGAQGQAANPVFAAAQRGVNVNANPVLIGDVAAGAKNALEGIPGTQATNARTQALLAASIALKNAERRGIPVARAMAWPAYGALIAGHTMGAVPGGQIGHEVAGALAGELAANPALQRFIGRNIAQPDVLSGLPRAVAYTMSQLNNQNAPVGAGR